MTPGLLVTATDTGVGKTLVAAAIVTLARKRGLDVGALKPAESGCAKDERGALIPADALLLQAAAGGLDPLELVCPYRFEVPLAPGIAAALEGGDIVWAEIERSFRTLGARHADGVVVEGAGGLLVPMAAEFGIGVGTTAELAKRLELPVLVVARAGLGTINHTALTLEVLASRGLQCRGVVLSARNEAELEAAPLNASAIERFGGEVLAVLPPLVGEGPAERIERAVELLERPGQKLDPVRLLA